MPDKRRSLILAGGGLKVAFQAGVMQVWLDEADLTFDHVDGASGGVFNLAMLCQGLSGTAIADKWRQMQPLQGVSFGLPQLTDLPHARSMFTLDGYRQHVFPTWGLNWSQINASPVEATFNVYNFTQHELEVKTAGEMSEDWLCACVSLPMWFPPIEIAGQTYIDSVYLTDANLEEAISRGADEIWVIWTVSQRGLWQNGFIANYFQIIEAAANGHFKRICRRIEANNQAIATGDIGEFGRPIELKLLAADVPLHYLLNLSGDRLHETVNLGVQEARRWCATQGIPLKTVPTPAPTDVHTVATALQFTEQMKGFVTPGESDYSRGYEAGKKAKSGLKLHLTIVIDGVNRFVTNPQHEARIDGYIQSEAFGGKRPVLNGAFNLLVDREDPNRKAMYYRLFVKDDHEQPLTILGFKDISDEPGADAWEDTAILYTRVLRGHVSPDGDGGAAIVASGMVKIHFLDFLEQLTTFQVQGPTLADRTAALGRFGRLFLGKLWDVYAQRILPSI